MNKQQTFGLFGRHVSAGKAKFYQDVGIDFVLGRRAGPYMWDLDGSRRLINCHCNGGVFNLGHHNPRIVAALEEALTHLDMGNHHLVSEQRARLAARLAELTPGELQYAIFGVSGGEAVDAAIKIARKATQRPRIISADLGYHGHTGLALETANRFFTEDAPDLAVAPLTGKEIDAYYREDKFIWSSLLAARRADRFIKTRLLGRKYNFILPGPVKR